MEIKIIFNGQRWFVTKGPRVTTNLNCIYQNENINLRGNNENSQTLTRIIVFKITFFYTSFWWSLCNVFCVRTLFHIFYVCICFKKIIVLYYLRKCVVCNIICLTIPEKLYKDVWVNHKCTVVGEFSPSLII